MKRCPKCGADSFFVTAYVTQDWCVDGNGNFLECTEDCVEVIHTPDDEDVWECVKCGHEAAGKEFNVKEEK